MCVDLRLPEVHGSRVLRLVGDDLLHALLNGRSVDCDGRQKGPRDRYELAVDRGRGRALTKLSKTHLLSFHSAGRHCQSWWLLLSRHSQWARNCARQDLLMSSMLPSQPVSPYALQAAVQPVE